MFSDPFGFLDWPGSPRVIRIGTDGCERNRLESEFQCRGVWLQARITAGRVNEERIGDDGVLVCSVYLPSLPLDRDRHLGKGQITQHGSPGF